MCIVLQCISSVYDLQAYVIAKFIYPDITENNNLFITQDIFNNWL